jgi:hypothetical protein
VQEVIRNRRACADRRVTIITRRPAPVARPECQASRCGRAFLEELAGFPARSFEKGLSRVAIRLDLGAAMNAKELRRLYDAAFLSALCNIVFNRRGARHGTNRESRRVALEQEFMASQDRLFRCVGWKRLPAGKKGAVKRILLSVRVDEENLAPGD